MFDRSICTAPKGHIGTYSGGYICPLDPDPKTINILDIAHSLSLGCRWGGHCKHHYSIGLHSLVVARMLFEWGQPMAYQLQGLLHDASEAYLNDLPSPIKYDPTMTVYREGEKRLEICINEKFGCPFRVKDDCPVVAKADFIALCIEGRDLFAYRRAPEVFGVREWPTEEKLYQYVSRIWFPGRVADVNSDLIPWLTPKRVEEKFLEVFEHGFADNGN